MPLNYYMNSLNGLSNALDWKQSTLQPSQIKDALITQNSPPPITQTFWKLD